MIRFFLGLSIKQKITTIIMLISVCILGIGFTIEARKNIKWYKKDLLNSTTVNTKLIGEYCISPLFFYDKQGAIEVLSKMEANPNFQEAYLFDNSLKIFVEYSVDKKESSVKNIKMTSYHQFTKTYLTVSEPIVYDGQNIGVLVVKVSTASLQDKINNLLLALLVIFLGLFIFSFILANQLQKIISNPISKLAFVTKEITNKSDYSLRIRTNSNDEIGELYQGFNIMLEHLQNREIERDNAEKNLKEAKEKAEQSDKLKSAFLANMSHEIRTPMNSIIGFSSLLSEEDLTLEKKKEYVELINSSGNSLLNLIDDIIDISKIEAEQINITINECNIGSILNEINISFSEKMRIKNKDKDVELIYKIDNAHKSLSIKTDPYRLRQVLSNLLNNAIKFTETGFVEFGINTISDKYIEFFVRDTGIGLSKDKQEVIFDRFRKIEDDNTKLYRGAGLGLTICKKIVELLGGEIWVESSLGKGSVFYFSIPNNEADAVIEEPVIQTSITKQYDWSDKKILVAEDEEYNFLLINEILKKTNIKIIWAKNGVEAVNLFKANKSVNLVLMDIKMPDMNGYEATKKIKEMNRRMPVIAQTAYAMTAEKEKSFEVGCDNHIAKPINPKELLAILSQYLS